MSLKLFDNRKLSYLPSKPEFIPNVVDIRTKEYKSSRSWVHE